MNEILQPVFQPAGNFDILNQITEAMLNTIKDLDATVINAFKAEVRGQIILPGDAGYKEECRLYNAMIQKHPGMIIKCMDVADVISAVNFGRENNLLVAVRGGGHNGGGLGSCDDGMVISLSGIKYVRVDTATKTVRVGGGNTWGEIDHATHPFGLAIPGGIISTTGVGGLTLGGGIGYLTRKYGLSIDNLLEADVVLADGSFITANEDNYSDLFWAIRGGGGNFGVVTSFKFRAHPVKSVYGGPTLWPVEQTKEMMAWYDDFLHAAPDDLNGFFVELMIPGPPFPEFLHHKKFCGVVWCYAGHISRAEEIFKPILETGPIFQHIGKMPYPAIQKLFDGLFPPGLQWYWKADFFNESVEAAREKHLEFGLKIPTLLSQMHLYPVSGAAGRIANDATAWAYRNARYAGVVVGVDPAPENAKKLTRWCRDYWQELHPYSCGGAYLNFMMNEGQERIKASYRGNYERLRQIKSKYDPNNFLRVNQNILPAKS